MKVNGRRLRRLRRVVIVILPADSNGGKRSTTVACDSWLRILRDAAPRLRAIRPA